MRPYAWNIHHYVINHILVRITCNSMVATSTVYACMIVKCGNGCMHVHIYDPAQYINVYMLALTAWDEYSHGTWIRATWRLCGVCYGGPTFEDANAVWRRDCGLRHDAYAVSCAESGETCYVHDVSADAEKPHNARTRFYISTLVCLCISTFLHFCISTFLHLCISAVIHFCISTCLYFCISTFLHFCI